MRGRYAALAIMALGAGVAGGIWYERDRLAQSMEAGSNGPEILYWVAPMDTNFRKDGPGKSPMGMDLVPVYEGQKPSGDPEEVTLSPAEVNTIGVRSAVARVEEISRRIDTVGFVDYDEHATSHIHTRVDGWIERLEVRAVGDEVAEGDLLFDLYAPEITIASSELQRATRSGNAANISIARTKLMNFGVDARQIEEMAQAVSPSQRIRFYAPQDGVVFALAAADGMFLNPQTRAMSLADTSSVWLIVDVFERDMGRLSSNMRAEARFDHLPGRVFAGEIDYIFPELDTETRTLRVRLRFDNEDGLLRPNMFANVSLIPAEAQEALTVPSEAVIRTGRAERVILKQADDTFRPRLVTTGLRGGFGAGGRTEIVQGLAPGDEVVASAQFLIDSESALNAGMMRFAPTDAEPAMGKGVLASLDSDRRLARIGHEPIEALGWPAMETRFAIRSDVYLEDLAEGDEVEFTAVRGADGLIALTELGRDDGVDATGTGMVHAVTPEGKLTVSHEPIPALGWPAMKMDLDVAGVDTDSVPLDTPVTFDLASDENGMFAIVAVRAEGEMKMAEAEDMAEEAPSTPPITVEGRIEAVDPEARTATIDHGPIKEIGMPGMTMDFALSDAVDPADLPTGQDLSLTFLRPDGMAMVLDAVEATPEPMTVTGTINSIDAEAGTANITHGPIQAIGMPSMTMDFALAGALDASSLPVGQETGLLLLQGADMSLSLAGTVELGQ
ncbi:membrane fusion protein, Cu(I)/Ag(I) efflux system [Roseovarius tolerans]|uniref:Membrane fusion protein, Cu(I)/Ag(I) efflux system n=2 Tax=Roseobacteraceae TaxID=2854170 RepID=A0A1H8IRK7_9RHOB|nr:efflux RND transporter periplasmic adaptor subunit [Roseovarius tolerans]SEN71550.1 membrane fusion protein, Cu(I)/Ag(I) efflux system [Roseovarius tolerans]